MKRIFLILLVLVGAAYAQNECGSLQNLTQLNAADTIGTVHQNACWNALTHVLTFPLEPAGGGISGPGQLGDTLRFGINNDSQWDPTNATTLISTIYPIMGGPPLASGQIGQGNVPTVGSYATNIPTVTTTGPIGSFSSAATASTVGVMGLWMGHNGNNSVLMSLAFYRWTLTIQFGGFTNARYWMGRACWCGGACAPGAVGNNALALIGTAAFTADNPNKTMVGFRFSATTDTHWQAIAENATAGTGNITVVDTGITPDTGIHTYEMTTNFAGTQVNYIIDNVVVASITTNLPLPSTTVNYQGEPFWTADNKNTATALSANFYKLLESEK